MSTTSGALLSERYEVPEEERSSTPRRRESYEALIARLSHQSVVKHFDAYADIPWDDPAYRIDPDDPRWELPADDALGATTWYQSQPAGVRSRIGLHLFATFMKIGVEFESVLKRGLLEFGAKLPNGSPEFRYAYHEVIEEAQHSLMFQEFVNRTGFDIAGLVWWQRLGARQVIRFARTFPALFFVFVLAGEDPIDHVQRMALKSGRSMHPLLRRIMQIHVTEEARHLCFARHYLRQNVEKLGWFRRFVLSRRAPFILAVMAQLMLRPSADIIRTYAIPKDVIRAAYTANPAHRAGTFAAIRKIRDLLTEVGVVTPSSRRLWRMLGIWEPGTAVA
ncbi:MAG TPA: diiron oxygenase [Candidatus Eisenbacteria bacterium]|nr:diiron oxygenase [Candidatus Eisenbacteria bacterium]